MSRGNHDQAKSRKSFRRRVIPIAVGVAIVFALVCFIIAAMLPRPAGPFFEAPLHSLLTGLGLLSVACPPLIAGSLLKKRAEASPYFEEAFIRAGFNVVGFVCLVLGLVCVGLSIYAVAQRLFGA
jgi:hypothetical protein